MLLVMLFTLRRGLRGKRLFAVLGIVALPCVLSLLVSTLHARPRDQEIFFYTILSTVHLTIVVPCVALAMATAFPWPEAEEGTLTYWFTAPVWRWAVHLGRYLATIVLGSLFLPIAFIGAYLPLTVPEGADLWPITAQAVLVTLMAFPAYVGIFGLVSTLMRRGFIFGVAFMVLENSLAMFQGNIQSLTVIYYERAYLWKSIPDHMHRYARDTYMIDPKAQIAEASDAMIVFALVPVLALSLALVVIHVIEYRAKQGHSA